MPALSVPTRDQISPANQALFDRLQQAVGFVPNMYAVFAHSGTALGDYLALQNRKSSLRATEREVVNLVVSEVNGCRYCLAAHTQMGKTRGLTDEQILEIRAGTAHFDPRLDALARLVRATVASHGHPDAAAVEAFFAAGYTAENVVDVVLVIGDKTITNYLHGIAQVPVDFPAAPKLAESTG